MGRRYRAQQQQQIDPALLLRPDAKIKPFGPRAQRFCARTPEEDARYNFLVGAVRSAKTWSLFTKIIGLCSYPVAGLKLLTGISKDAVYRNVLNDLFEIVGESNYNYNRQNGQLHLCGAKWQVIGAHDEGSEKYIRGATIGACVADEVVLMPRNFYYMLISRMSPPGAKLYGSTNPADPYHWFKKEVLDSTVFSRGLGPTADLWWQTWTMDDNPSLTEDYKNVLKRSYTGIWYKRYILGQWVLADGAIYRDVLTDDVFYTDETRPIGLKTRAVERWVTVDAGTVNPQVYIDCYDDGYTVWADKEWYFDSRAIGRQMTDSEYADALVKFFDVEDPRRWPGVIIDPSAASFRVELIKRGIYVVDADNEVENGIRKTSSALSRRILRINKQGCPKTVQEMQTYAWDEKRADNGKEQPIKSHDHGPDALRYYVNTRLSEWRIAA